MRIAAAPTIALAAEVDDLRLGVAAYTQQAITQIAIARDGARRMQEAVAYGNAGAARRAWLASHAAWEQSETFTGSLYPDLHEAIDAWPHGHTGYHAIEPLLFNGSVSDIKPGVDQLVEALEDLVNALRSHGLTAQGILSGTARLALETAEHKLDGAESAISATSYDDIRNNVKGLRAVVTIVVAPALEKRDPATLQRAKQQLDQMETLLRAPDLRSLDRTRYARTAEDFAATIRVAALKLGLKAPAPGY